MKFNLRPAKFKFDKKFIFYFLSLFIIFFIMNSCRWTYHNFHRVNFDEIGIVLNSGFGGTDSDLIHSFLKKSVWRSLWWVSGLSVLCSIYKNIILTIVVYMAVFAMFIHKLSISNIQLGSVFNNTKSNFYETEYVDPKSVKITWPKRRNVLFIALESIEKIYGNQEVFGEVLTPHITQLEKENISFENYHSVSGLSHTIAAITGFTTGLPLFFTAFSNIEKMAGLNYGIGNIFKDAGYKTYSIFPASGKFSLKSNFMQRVGFDDIHDGEYIITQLTNPPNLRPFHGVDDGILFEYSKPIIQNIINQKQPYFIFMETINTHCRGYFTEYCEKIGFQQKTMQDITMCDDKIISDFVKWFRKSDPTAVIILVNDHKQHQGSLMKKLEKIEDRPLANVFINTPIFNATDLTRPVTAMDFFPTIVESAGAKINGCRLGLGTSLSNRCQNVKTLRERYSDSELENLMEQKNDLYYKLSTGKDKK